MRVAVYQGPGADLSLPAEARMAVNLDIMGQTACRAAGEGASLVVFPELFLTNYNIGEELRTLAEPADGPSAQRAAVVAKEFGVALCYGFPERASAGGDAVYNSLAVINRQGELVATHRKSHLYGDDERRYFTPGDELTLVSLEGWKLGLAVCYDIEFPEFSRALALAGAEAVVVCTALMEPFGFVAEQLVPARAIENQAYVIYANRCGSEGGLTYCGHSRIVDPVGRGLAKAGGEGVVLFADLSRDALADARRLNTYLRDRRPELYASPVRLA